MPVYDLCPKCGAVSKDGLCSSCGYKIPGIYGHTEEKKEAVDEAVTDSNSTDNMDGVEKVAMPKYYSPAKEGNEPAAGKKNNAGLIILAVVAGLVAILVLGILGITYFAARTVIGGIKEEIQSENHTDDIFDFNFPGNSAGDDDYIYRYGSFSGTLSDYLAEDEKMFSTDSWVKMEESSYSGTVADEYEFDDYIDGNVSYSVEKGVWAYSNEDGYYDTGSQIFPHYLYMTGTYVRLRNTGLKNEDAVNSMIYKKAVEAAEVGEHAVYYLAADGSEVAYIYTDAYVTYMDEEVISILFNTNGYIVSGAGTENEEATDIMSHLCSINIDLNTGKEIKASETFAFGGDFYKTFKARCLEQNGAAVDYYDDETLVQILTDDNQVIWAYTPLGLEVGVNRQYHSGWSTGTFVNYKQFYKIY